MQVRVLQLCNDVDCMPCCESEVGVDTIPLKQYANGKMEALPRVELGLLDSKSKVITTTPQRHAAVSAWPTLSRCDFPMALDLSGTDIHCPYLVLSI